MSLGAYLGVCLAAAAGALILRRWTPASLAIGVAGLLASLVVSLTIHPGDMVSAGGSVLVATDFTRLVAVLASASVLVLCCVGLATSWQRNVPPVALLTLAGLVASLAAPDPTTAVLASIAGGLGAVLVSVVAPIGARGVQAGARTLRAGVAAGALAIGAIVLVGDPNAAFSLDPAVLGVAYLAAAIAVAIRFAAIPFHAWGGRLADTAPEVALPIVLAWAPAGLAAVILAWVDASVTPILAPLEIERGIVVAIGAIGIIVGAFAAWIQDDVDHVVAYSFAQDAGFVILALGALDPVAWEPARTWLVIFVLSKTALAAWLVAIRASFGTRRVDELAGWAPAAPLLAVSLIAIVVATLGWPGSASWAARGELIRAAMTDPLGILVTVGGLSSVLYYGRLLAVGFAAPTGAIRSAPSWRPRLPPTTGRPWRAATGGPRATVRASIDHSPAQTTIASGRVDDAAPPATERRARAAGIPAELSARLSAAGEAWRLNRAPIAAALVLVLAAVAVGGAAGGLGLPESARAAAPIAPELLHPAELTAPSGEPGGEPTSEPTTEPTPSPLP